MGQVSSFNRVGYVSVFIVLHLVCSEGYLPKNDMLKNANIDKIHVSIMKLEAHVNACDTEPSFNTSVIIDSENNYLSILPTFNKFYSYFLLMGKEIHAFEAELGGRLTAKVSSGMQQICAMFRITHYLLCYDSEGKSY